MLGNNHQRTTTKMRAVLQVVSAIAVVGILTFHSFQWSDEIRSGGKAYFFGFRERMVNKTTTDNKLQQLVFHVGPGKMGSSTIQSALVHSSETLKEDGWVSYNHIPLGALNRCLAKNTCTSERIQEFQDFLRQAEQENRNIVLSTETWFSASRELSWYQELFQAYHVTIVVAYRRYYNWLPSRYYQLNRFRCRPNTANEGRSQANRGRGIPPLHAYLSATPFDHPSVSKIARVSPYFDNIEVINIETEDIVQKLFCHILGAHQTCQELQSSGHPTTTNQGKTLTFDRLAQYLIENDRVDPTKVDKMVHDLRLKLPKYGESECASLAMILEKYDKRYGQKVRNGDFPLLCPLTNVTERLFDVSAEAERILFPDEYSQDSIWKDFASKLNTTLFCDIDLQAVLAGEKWQSLLAKMRGP